jgi:hypothetical protein
MAKLKAGNPAVTLRTEHPATFGELIDVIEGIRTAQGHLWFRGCNNAAHKLLPSLYRHRTKTKIGELSKLENNLVTRFRQRSIPFRTGTLADKWDYLFFMQHYLVPTRLLDWTENPFVAAYFAIIDAQLKVTKSGKMTFSKAAAVWVLNPIAWNRHALSHQSFDEGILTPDDEELKGYKPGNAFKGMNNFPVAIYGAHNSPRIVAQRGVFTIFGQNTEPMEKAYISQGFPQDSLVKIVFEKNVLQKLRESIFDHGMTESVVFPDLDGLGREIRRAFEFEV